MRYRRGWSNPSSPFFLLSTERNDMSDKVEFNFKSTKGQKVTLSVEPIGFKIQDKGAFEGHLKKVIDFIQVTGYKVAKVVNPKKDKAKETAKEIRKAVQMVDPNLTSKQVEPSEQEETDEAEAV
jgi:hypothetical protein